MEEGSDDEVETPVITVPDLAPVADDQAPPGTIDAIVPPKTALPPTQQPVIIKKDYDPKGIIIFKSFTCPYRWSQIKTRYEHINNYCR